MKLCRFDLVSSPGTVRSGIVHGGKIYETDGLNPVAVHEPADARLLSPIGHPPSIRLFSAVRPAYLEWIESESQEAGPGISFSYLNPATLVGPNVSIAEFGLSQEIACKPCLALVLDDSGHGVSAEEAFRHVVGVTLGLVFYALDIEREELARGAWPSRSHDVGIAVGPALTTPDELDSSIRPEAPASYSFEVSASANGQEFLRSSLADLPWGLGEPVSCASASAPLLAGDIFLISLGSSRPDSPIKPGTEIRVFSDRLGNLAVRYGE